MKEKKEATLLHALIPIVVLIATLAVSIQVYEAAPHIPLIFATVIAAGVAVFMLGYSWSELEEGIIDTIKLAMQAVLILMVIGSLIGTWILSGTVPTMIYYGLNILTPGIFLVATVVICAIVSVATGSSWTTAGTVGIALLGVGIGLELPIGLVAGAIISGSYFGDKMSPLSDTTNLAPAMAGTNLFAHIRSMLYTTTVSFALTLVTFGVLGFIYSSSSNVDTASIDAILEAIKGNFNTSPLLLIPPVIVILLVVNKIPALPGLISGVFLGGIFAAIFQGSNLGDIINAAHYGFSIESGNAVIDELLNRGGLDGMMWTVSLILIALTFGGVMEKTGMLNAVGKSILKFANNTGSLVLSTILTCIAVNLLTGEQYLSIVVPGRMYKDAYREKGIHPSVLSRTLEGGGTVTSALIPWNTCGAFMWTTLGVHPFVYAPYAVFNILEPLVNILFAYLGIGIIPLESDSEVQPESTMDFMSRE
nr:Na+/H+ antiporter NhaC [Alkaliphilus hydrothermalis]